MLSRTLLPGDEELGKKDDDFQSAPARRSGWSPWNHAFRWRRRRVLLAVAGMFLVYLLLWRVEEPLRGMIARPRYPQGRPMVLSAHDAYETASDDDEEPTGPPPGIQRPKRGEAPPRTYNGHARFFRLASTLHPQATHTSGYDVHNRNVVFAISSLNSASTLLPMICEMSRWGRNYVHAAFLGRENIPIEDVLDINGIDRTKCPAVWHDARPDYMEYSSEARAEAAVIGALSLIHRFLHPQVAIVDDLVSEDLFFARGMRDKTKKLAMSCIEVPKNRLDDLYHLTRLDAASLKAWHLPTVDILIQVPPESSSVLRLLKSITDADYSGLKPPRITLELPAELDDSVKRHLENFKWPPGNDGPSAQSGLIIKRLITNHRTSQEGSAMRFLELFYPANFNSHVLLLSPQAQLSPQYFHYVQYALLEYKYSALSKDDDINLLGLSLEVPSVLLDGKTNLVTPTVSDMHTDLHKKLYPTTKSVPFLWQAPNSHATLFLGDKWAELHSFLGDRVTKGQQSPKHTSRPKLVTETLPSWTEYMLEFMRARGYALLYPATTSTALVTIHNELYHAPEEFTPRPLSRAGPLAPPELPDEPFLRDEEPPQPPKNPEPPVTPASMPLYMVLPFTADLPEMPHLPLLLYDGKMVDPINASAIATDYASTFRQEVGGCTIPKGKHKKVVAGQASDLFCFGDEDEDDWEDDAPEVLDTIEAPVSNAREKLMADALRPKPSAVPLIAEEGS